jgi:hypothetical protein
MHCIKQLCMTVVFRVGTVVFFATFPSGVRGIRIAAILDSMSLVLFYIINDEASGTACMRCQIDTIIGRYSDPHAFLPFYDIIHSLFHS